MISAAGDFSLANGRIVVLKKIENALNQPALFSAIADPTILFQPVHFRMKAYF